MGDLRDHWERVYTSKDESAVSWYQPHAVRSVNYITATADKGTPVIDVGGGASTLVDDLLTRGFSQLTVLDISAASIAKAKTRLGKLANEVTWIVADITQWEPPCRYGIWHDRAVFHFMTSTADQDGYIRALCAGTAEGSIVVISTFALDGPEKCSGLPVQRYSAESLAKRIGLPFVLIDEAVEVHRTPWAAEQKFNYVVLRRQK